MYLYLTKKKQVEVNILKRIFLMSSSWMFPFFSLKLVSESRGEYEIWNEMWNDAQFIADLNCCAHMWEVTERYLECSLLVDFSSCSLKICKDLPCFFIWGSSYSHGSYSLIVIHVCPTADSLCMSSKVAHMFRGVVSLFTVYQLQLNPKPSSQSVLTITSQSAHIMCFH